MIEGSLHVMPEGLDLGKEHFCSARCWCSPEVYQPCPECEDKQSSCWKCSGRGLVPVFTPDLDVIYVHNAADGR